LRITRKICFIVPTHNYSDYHPEHHYVIQTSWNYVLQETILLDEFYDDRLAPAVLTTPNTFKKNILFSTQWGNIMPNYFKFITASGFKQFFQRHQIDIPTFFKPSKSLYRSSNEIFLLKFSNYIFRGGKLFKTSKLLNLVLWDLFSKTMNFTYTLPQARNNIGIKTKLYIDMCLYYHMGYFKLESKDNSLDPKHGEYSKLGTHLYKTLKKLKPVFSFYIYKIDKMIYKNTRGKSGKFTFIWKYIAPYKRNFLVLSWLAKELRTKSGHNFNKRLKTLLVSLLFDPKTLWPYKIKKFSHNYVYRNCRKTLAESYVTSTS
jgi:hypothetical protein